MLHLPDSVTVNHNVTCVRSQNEEAVLSPRSEMRKWHFKQSTCRPVLQRGEEIMFLNQTPSRRPTPPLIPTHTPVRADLPRSAQPPPRATLRFPKCEQAAFLHPAEAVLKNISNVIFNQHFATAHFKCDHRNLRTLNYFGGKELNTGGPRPFGGQSQA